MKLELLPGRKGVLQHQTENQVERLNENLCQNGKEYTNIRQGSRWKGEIRTLAGAGKSALTLGQLGRCKRRKEIKIKKRDKTKKEKDEYK